MKNKKVEELVERVKLTDEEIIKATDNEKDRMKEFGYEPGWKDIAHAIAEAQLKKVLNDPALAIIVKVGIDEASTVEHTHPEFRKRLVIPLVEALKEE